MQSVICNRRASRFAGTIDFNFIQINYELSEDLSLDRKEQLVSRVESVLAPMQDELNAKSIYSWWSNRWTMTRIYMDEGHANEKDIIEARLKLREVMPEMPGVKLQVMDGRPEPARTALPPGS